MCTARRRRREVLVGLVEGCGGTVHDGIGIRRIERFEVI